MLLLYVCPDLSVCCVALLPEVVLDVGLRYAGGAVRVTLLEVPALTFVAEVLFVVALLTEELPVPLLGVGEVVTVDVLRLVLLRTLDPPLSELPPPAVNLSEPV